ncbi:hypothetical protein [Chryseobacterium sp. MEBOG07]|uniref:hypothetical protein n=1 Tax=Chryseobacterium sp. MEBOG07 TaxID=2879939 RepID=UPI001F344542|nr:hypothetical protein [Chryseobacterium sp. MEBOG07]UKB79566.1 hypothetical protein LF886_00735 [Chryseobacterium sp. MEBOG07]
MKTRTITLLLIALSLVACESQKEKEREKLKEFTISQKGYSITKSATPFIAITSYSIYYNPLSNGTVKITLEDGSAYTSKNLEGSNISAVILLLKDSRTVFDTNRKELAIREAIDK